MSLIRFRGGLLSVPLLSYSIGAASISIAFAGCPSFREKRIPSKRELTVEDLTSCSESPLDLLVPRVHREHQARLNDNIVEDHWEIKAFARTTNDDDDVLPHAPKMRVLLWEDFQGTPKQALIIASTTRPRGGRRIWCCFNLHRRLLRRHRPQSAVNCPTL